jgi:hypothetical protein
MQRGDGLLDEREPPFVEDDQTPAGKVEVEVPDTLNFVQLEADQILL